MLIGKLSGTSRSHELGGRACKLGKKTTRDLGNIVQSRHISFSSSSSCCLRAIVHSRTYPSVCSAREDLNIELCFRLVACFVKTLDMFPVVDGIEMAVRGHEE